MCHGPRGASDHRGCPGSRLAGRTGRHLGPALPCRMGRLWLQQHSWRAGAWLCLLPPRCLGKADGEPLLQAVLQSWHSPIPQKATFCLLDGSQRPWESLGTLLHWGVDGFCQGERDGTTAATPLPLARFPGSQQHTAPLQCFTSVAECQPTSSLMAVLHRGRLVLPAKEEDVPPALLQWAR